MPSKKAPKIPALSCLEAPSIEGDSPPIVDDDPAYNPRDDGLFNDNKKKKVLISISESMSCAIFQVIC
jgi:hypothetical protein